MPPPPANVYLIPQRSPADSLQKEVERVRIMLVAYVRSGRSTPIISRWSSTQIVDVYIPIIRIPIKGEMIIPNIGSLDHGTYDDKKRFSEFTGASNFKLGKFHREYLLVCFVTHGNTHKSQICLRYMKYRQYTDVDVTWLFLCTNPSSCLTYSCWYTCISTTWPSKKTKSKQSWLIMDLKPSLVGKIIGI